ncbi:hypothetical protein FRB96_006464 [Tulasnella sp. 330]|nr:hypothetical protein FRB96_006464 [Tulasnella sp. 330]KAG8879122.1 hypothetical protein FRB97_001947 [Tulasnella sp. 331]KAG8888025.1 hypothetical protein FRB98_008559 [Tulasnella sp. 332]
MTRRRARRQQHVCTDNFLRTVIDPGFNSWWSNMTKMRCDDHSNAGRVEEVNNGFVTPGRPLAKRSKKSTDQISPAASAFDPGGHDRGDISDTFGFQDQMKTVDFGDDYTGGGDFGGNGQRLSSVAEIARRGSSLPTSLIGSFLDGGPRSNFSRDDASNDHVRSQRVSAAFPWSQDHGKAAPGMGSSPAFGGSAAGGGFASSSSVHNGVFGGVEGDSQGIRLHDELDFPLGGAQEYPIALEDDSQRTDMSLITLERTLEKESLSVLQYLRRHVDPMSKKTSFREFLSPQGLQSPDRRVAATGFYYILAGIALSTKGHIRVRQGEAYQEIHLQILD